MNEMDSQRRMLLDMRKPLARSAASIPFTNSLFWHTCVRADPSAKHTSLAYLRLARPHRI